MFIVIEGGDGVGKTTFTTALVDKLSTTYSVLKVREPGGTDYGESVRSLLLHPESTLDNLTVLLALFSTRVEHIKKVILPALKAGKIVVCERFNDSTYVYQVAGKANKELSRVFRTLEGVINSLITVDLPLLLTVDHGTVMERLKGRSITDAFESQTHLIEFRAKEFLARTKEKTKEPLILNTSRLDTLEQNIESVVTRVNEFKARIEK